MGAIPACTAGGIPACLAAGLQGGGVTGPGRAVCSWGVCSWGGGFCSWVGCLVPGGSALERVPGEDPPGTATAVGGTHPTGMHSCMTYFYRAEGGGHGHLAPWIRY